MHTHAYIIFIYLSNRIQKRKKICIWLFVRFNRIHLQPINRTFGLLVFISIIRCFTRREFNLLESVCLSCLLSPYYYDTMKLCTAPHSFTWDKSMYNDRIDCGQTHLLLSMIGKWIVMSTHYKTCGPIAVASCHCQMHWNNPVWHFALSKEKEKWRKKVHFICRIYLNSWWIIKRRWK